MAEQCVLICHVLYIASSRRRVNLTNSSLALSCDLLRLALTYRVSKWSGTQINLRSDDTNDKQVLQGSKLQTSRKDSKKFYRQDALFKYLRWYVRNAPVRFASQQYPLCYSPLALEETVKSAMWYGITVKLSETYPCVRASYYVAATMLEYDFLDNNKK